MSGRCFFNEQLADYTGAGAEVTFDQQVVDCNGMDYLVVQFYFNMPFGGTGPILYCEGGLDPVNAPSGIRLSIDKIAGHNIQIATDLVTAEYIELSNEPLTAYGMVWYFRPPQFVKVNAFVSGDPECRTIIRAYGWQP